MPPARRTTPIHRALVTLSTIAAAVGLAMSTMPAANADTDDDFLLALRQIGVLPVGDSPAGRAGLVAMGHWACDQLEKGSDPQNVVSWMNGYNQAHNADFGATDARVLREAARFYCPAYKDAVEVIASRARPR